MRLCITTRLTKIEIMGVGYNKSTPANYVINQAGAKNPTLMVCTNFPPRTEGSELSMREQMFNTRRYLVVLYTNTRQCVARVEGRHWVTSFQRLDGGGVLERSVAVILSGSPSS